MNEDLELRPLQIVCEGALVTIKHKNSQKQGILLGSISARNRVSYAIVLVEEGKLIRVSQREPLGFCENIMIQELLSHDNELVREWFAGLARGDYSREHLAAWFLEVQEEQRQEAAMVNHEELLSMQDIIAQKAKLRQRNLEHAQEYLCQKAKLRQRT